MGKSFMAWTDYPITEMGDEPGKIAPIRRIRLIGYDRNKYVIGVVAGHTVSIKAGYIYQRSGRLCEVPNVSYDLLCTLPETTYVEDAI